MNTLRNSVRLYGNVGKEPEVKTFDNGNKVATFSLATSEKRKNLKGEYLEETSWHNLVVWGKQDKFLPVTHVGVLKPLLANAQYELIDNCGHVPMTEIAQRFNQLTLAFLAPST